MTKEYRTKVRNCVPFATPEAGVTETIAVIDFLEKRVEDLEAALECSYTLACRGVERIDEENKTCGPRLSLVHRRRLTIMCNQIKYHKDKWLRAEEKDNA